MESHRLTEEELDEQFEQFLKESVSDESGDLGGSAKRTSVLDSLGKPRSQRPAKKAASSSLLWWQDDDDDDITGGTGRGSSRRSFQKSSRKSQPIREEEEEEFLGPMTFSHPGVPSRVSQEPEDSVLTSGPDLNPGPGLETLEEEEEKARFFARLEAGASSTLDYSQLNRELDSTRSTPAPSLRKREDGEEGSEEDQRPAAERVSPARPDSPDYSDHFEDDEPEKEPEKEPPEKVCGEQLASPTPQMSSLDAKVSLYDSVDSTNGPAPSEQHRGKEPAVSVDKGQSYGQSGGSDMEALQEAYRQISDAPGDAGEREDGGRGRPSPPASSPLDQSRGDHLPASTNGSELPTAEELMRPIRPETSTHAGGFTLQPSSSGPDLDLRPGSDDRRPVGVKPGPAAEPRQSGGSSGSGSPESPPRRRPLSIREEVERLMEDQDPDHHGRTPVPSTLASRAKQKPRGAPFGRAAASSARRTPLTSAPRGSRPKEPDRSTAARRFSGPGGRPAARGRASPPTAPRRPAARAVRRSPTPPRGRPETNSSDDLIASVQSFAAFLQQRAGSGGPQVATATWDANNARKDAGPAAARGLAGSDAEEGSVVEGMAHGQREHLSQRETDLAQRERELHLRLEEVEMRHREDLSAVKQENYVLQSKLRSAEESSQGSRRWAEAADPGTRDRLQLLEKEMQQQETIIQGYHQENEKLCREMKAQQTRSRATEEAMFAENQRLLNELRRAKEHLKNAPGTPLNAMEHSRRITELLAQMEALQESEAKLSEESRGLRQQKQALEVDLQLMKKERDLAKAQVLATSGDQGAELRVREDAHRQEVAGLQEKLRWYAENQQLLDRDAGRLRAATQETRRLQEQLEHLKVEVGKSSIQPHNKAKEKSRNAKRIQALERQVKELEDLLRHRQPNSLPALIYAAAAAAASSPGGGDPASATPPTQVTGLLERKVARLEAELDGHKEEAKRGLRAVEQQFQRIKLHYEQQISELEQRLDQTQRQEGAAPPCPPTEASELQGVTEAHGGGVELALREQIQSLQRQLSRKARPSEPERAQRSPSRHQVQSEAAFGVRIERLTQELAAKSRSVQELGRTVERLQRERKGLLSGPRHREVRPAAAARPRVAPAGGGGGCNAEGEGEGGGRGEEGEERFPAAQYEKTYRPDAFAGSHITEVQEENRALREENRALRERLGGPEDRQEAGEPCGALAQARDELCRLKENTAEQLSTLAAQHRLEMDRLRAGHAHDHSSSRVAQLCNTLSTQEVVVQHLREQLKDAKATKDELALSKVREETLQNQLTRLLEELQEAREAHSPGLKHLRSLEAKVCSMELRHARREEHLKQLIGQTRQVVEAEQQSEAERWKRLAQGRGREVEAFRQELDAILDVLRELRRQGVVFPEPLLHAPFTGRS